MKRFAVLFSILAVYACSGAVWANSAPVVSIIEVRQRMDGSKKFDIRYNLWDADGDRCTVSVQVSGDGGSTWTVPAVSFSGAIGPNISRGTGKLITWDCAADLPGAYGTNYKVKITADDGSGPSGMVWVPIINDPGVPGHEGFNGYMSKYETTNAQYCQYLNAAKASGDIVVDGSHVKGASGSNGGADFVGERYYYLAGSGWTYNGATNGGAARINYTGSSFTVDSGLENHPVTYVSWYGSTAFCNYYGWRLPTEWEWQAVADYNGSYTYGCGPSINNSIANYKNSTHPYGTTVAGSFGTFGYGICDMAGNVWEWTDSCYYSDCDSGYRVLRGGCWDLNDSYCAVSLRLYPYPYITSSSCGFRACR